MAHALWARGRRSALRYTQLARSVVTTSPPFISQTPRGGTIELASAHTLAYPRSISDCLVQPSFVTFDPRFQRKSHRFTPKEICCRQEGHLSCSLFVSSTGPMSMENVTIDPKVMGCHRAPGLFSVVWGAAWVCRRRKRGIAKNLK